MAMNFWEAQRQARLRTTLYISIFVVLTLAIATLSELALRLFAEDNYNPSFPIFGVAFLLVTFVVAGYNYGMYRQYGGSYVAESVGGYRISGNSSNLKEQQLFNIVQEVALATTLPLPQVYVIPSKEINAFAAGLTPQSSAIAVTQGALNLLNREELQGVIAHEFGHIYNGDMVISMRLAAMVMGFFFVLYLGLRLLQMGRFRSRSDENSKGGNPTLIAALIFIVAGAITWFVGSILKATISRQREYLADASAVQFTRNPRGIANALRKIAKGQYQDMPSTGSAYSHMYIEDRSSIFATHPPIQKRIEAIEGKEYL